MKTSIATLGLLFLAVSTRSQTNTPHFIVHGSTEVPIAHQEQGSTWSQGAMIFISDRRSAAPSFRLIDRSGKEFFNITLTIPGASRINVYDNAFARGIDGSIAVIGTTFSDDNRGTTFLAVLSPDGKQKTIVRLSPFFPNAVTVASDGTIWVAGHSWVDGKPKDHGQNLIRRFDKNGMLLDSFLPWSIVNDQPHTLAPDTQSSLAPIGNKVAWFSPLGLTYLEFSLDGKVTRRVATPDVDKESVISFAACRDATYLAVTALATNKRLASWGIYELAAQEKDWKFFPQQGSNGIAQGCDNDHLAVETAPNTISWLGKPE